MVLSDHVSEGDESLSDWLVTSEAEPSIFDLLARGDWEGALASLNLQLIQQEAKVWNHDVSGESLLHVALFQRDPPLELVKILVNLNPSSTSCKDVGIKNTPLHHAVLDASLEVIQYLLEVDPSVANMRNDLLCTPLKRLVILDIHQSVGYQILNSRSSTARNVEIFQMLLKAMYPQFDQAGTFLLLHATVTWIQNEINLSGTAAKHLMQLLVPLVPSSELTTLDQFGNTPLHLACSGAIKQECHSVYCSPCSANNAQSSSFCLIAYLVRIHPLSASILHGEELPLHMVLKQTQYQVCSDALAALKNAHPRALTTIDPVLKLYPFQVAACGRSPSLSATYYLLRACPELERFV